MNVTTSFQLTQQQFKTATTYLKATVVVQPGGRQHPHAVLAIERKLAEAQAYALVAPNQGFVADIGGNPARHFFAGRRVWCLCPILDPMDELRENSRAQFPLHCNHAAPNCPHLGMAESALFVHSIYYLTPQQVLATLLATRTHSGASCHYQFDEPRGSHAGGEGQWKIDGKTVLYTVSGGKTYSHSTCDWLRHGYYEDSQGAMAWDTQGMVGECRLVQFRVVQRYPGWKSPAPVSLLSSLKDPNYYGEVVVYGAAQDQITFWARMAEVKIPTSLVVSLGKFLSFDSKEISMVVAKAFVDECALHIAGRARNSDTLGELTNWARKRVTSYHVPIDEQAGAVVAASVLAFVKNMDLEVSLYGGLSFVKSMSLFGSLSDRHEAARTLKTERIPTKWVATGLLLLVLTTRRRAPAASMFGSWPFIRRLWEWREWIALVGLFWVWLPKPDLSVYADYIYRYISYNRRNNTTQPTPSLPSVPGEDHDLKQLSHPRDRVTALQGIESKRRPDALVPAGIQFAGATPSANTADSETELKGIVGRIMDYPDADEKSVLAFSDWVKEHFDDLFPHRGWLSRDRTKPFIKSTEYQFWRSRFRGASATLIDKAYDTLITFPIDPVQLHLSNKKAFVKIEKSNPVYSDNVGNPSLKDPRIIQDMDKIILIGVGPWMHSLYHHISMCWNANHFIYAMAGRTNEEVGDLVYRIKQTSTDLHYGSGDVSRMDASVSHLIDLEHWIYAKFGADKTSAFPFAKVPGQHTVYDILRINLPTKGYSRHGIKYYKSQPDRHSGEPQTFIGNTVLAGLAAAKSVCEKLGCEPWMLRALSMSRAAAWLEGSVRPLHPLISGYPGRLEYALNHLPSWPRFSKDQCLPIAPHDPHREEITCLEKAGRVEPATFDYLSGINWNPQSTVGDLIREYLGPIYCRFASAMERTGFTGTLLESMVARSDAPPGMDGLPPVGYGKSGIVVILVGGDDILTLSELGPLPMEGELIGGGHSTGFASLGMKFKVEWSNSIYKAELYSCLFWPTVLRKPRFGYSREENNYDTQEFSDIVLGDWSHPNVNKQYSLGEEKYSGAVWRETLVLGPKPGRQLVRLPWSTSPDELKEGKRSVSMMQLRGIALGLKNIVSHIPFLKEYIDEILFRTANMAREAKEGEVAIVRSNIEEEWKLQTRESHSTYVETWTMLLERYGLERSDVEAFKCAISKVPMNHTLNSAIVARLVEVDCASTLRVVQVNFWRDVIAAPLIEELLKHTWFGHLVTAYVIAAEWIASFEHMGPLSYLPTAVFHYACYKLPFTTAWLLHLANNLLVFAGTIDQGYVREPFTERYERVGFPAGAVRVRPQWIRLMRLLGTWLRRPF